MRRRIITICLIVAVVFVGGLTAILINNAAGRFRGVDARHINHVSVSGNGGAAVAVDNYVYFVGNFVETSSIRFRQNEHNNVRYGAIFRVRLDPVTGLPEYDNEWIGYQEGLGHWEDNEDLNIDVLEQKYGQMFNSRALNIQMVVPKVAGHENTALWIYGNHLIYTSPNNQQNRRGVLQSDRLDFFRVNLSGRNHTRLFTANTPNLSRDNFTVAWAGGRAHLIVNDGNRLVHVDVSSGRQTRIATDHQGVAMPVTTSHFTAMKGSGGVMDFVYFTEPRSEEQREMGQTGLIMSRFNLATRTTEIIASENGVNYRPISLSGGHFLYEVMRPNVVGSVLYVVSGNIDPRPEDTGNGMSLEARFREMSVRVTNRLQQEERNRIYMPTVGTGNIFNFFTVMNGQLRRYSLSSSADSFGNNFSTVGQPIALGVGSIITITSDRIYYATDEGRVGVIDFDGNRDNRAENSADTWNRVASGGAPVSHVGQIPTSFMQLLPGAPNNAREVFFYMRTFTDLTAYGEGGETITAPVMVDASGRHWLLASLEERFVNPDAS